jgi:hypothetical protein
MKGATGEPAIKKNKGFERAFDKPAIHKLDGEGFASFQMDFLE